MNGANVMTTTMSPTGTTRSVRVGAAPAHHDGSELYVSDPAPEVGDTVTVFLHGADAGPVAGVHVCTLEDGEPVYVPARVDRRADGETWWRPDLPVRHEQLRYRFLLRDGVRARRPTGRGLSGGEVDTSADVAISTAPPLPDRARDIVVHQVFPDRFARSVASAAATRPLPDWAVRADRNDPVIARGPRGSRQGRPMPADGPALHVRAVG